MVTGAAGFIGSELAHALLARGDEVLGIDNHNDYYDPALKEGRVARFRHVAGYRHLRVDLADRRAMQNAFAAFRPQVVVNLAAQAGVRYSKKHPHAYADSNLVGFLNVLEGCRHYPVEHLVFASSSSVYGLNTAMPYAVSHNVDHPVSLYAATKKSNELMAHAYSHLYGIPATGLRFFTVYGPWGRPDMAYFSFTRRILRGESIDVYNFGRCRRDFTYVDDIVEGIVRVVDRAPQGDESWSGERPDPSRSRAPYRLFNIGNHHSVGLEEFIAVLEELLGRKAKRNLLPLESGDVPETFADVADLEREVGFAPATPIKEGLARFVHWYRDYYGE